MTISKTKSIYLRHLIKTRRWANTKEGEQTIVTIGAIWLFLGALDVFLLLVGIIEPSMGLNRAITLVISLYVVLLGCSVIIKSEE